MATPLTRMFHRANSRANALVNRMTAAPTAPITDSPGVGWRAASVVSSTTDPPLARRAGKAARTGKMRGCRRVSMARWICSKLISANGVGPSSGPAPALISMSIPPPWRLLTRSTRPVRSLGSLASPCSNSTASDTSRNRDIAAAPRSGVRPVTVTFTPRRASRRAVSRPTPPVPPVISAHLSARSRGAGCPGSAVTTTTVGVRPAQRGAPGGRPARADQCVRSWSRRGCPRRPIR